MQDSLPDRGQDARMHVAKCVQKKRTEHILRGSFSCSRKNWLEATSRGVHIAHARSLIDCDVQTTRNRCHDALTKIVQRRASLS